jgi:hypothetical protein
MKAANGDLVQMCSRAAALADERDSLMAQLRSSTAHRPPRSKRAPNRHDVAADTFGLVNKENEVPEGNTAASAACTDAVHYLQHPHDGASAAAKNVRFSSPLLTPKSSANAKTWNETFSDTAARRARGEVAAIQEGIVSSKETAARADGMSTLKAKDILDLLSENPDLLGSTEKKSEDLALEV